MKLQRLKRVILGNSERGLSAIELLIAMTVFLIVMSSVYGILKIGNLTRTNINSRSENIKNVRMAINSIGREAVNAGLGYNRIGGTVPDDFSTHNFGLPPDGDDDNDLLTAISAGFNINSSKFSQNGKKNDVVAFAFRDFQFNDGFPIEITDVIENQDHLILKTPDGACANCRPYDLFLIETGEGKQAVILSTNIVNGNQIVVSDAEPLQINFGKPTSGNDQFCLPTDLVCLSNNGGNGLGIGVGGGLGLGGLGGGGNGLGTNLGGINVNIGGSLIDRSTVKRCKNGNNVSCINYGSTQVIAKKIYLVSYSITEDGTLIRTTFGNNTGAPAEEQIVKQPIAYGIRSFKIKYLLSDGMVTEDPSIANTQKERCNEIIQIDVSVEVESDPSQSGGSPSDLITLTSTFSTRNLKYDVY